MGIIKPGIGRDAAIEDDDYVPIVPAWGLYEKYLTDEEAALVALILSQVTQNDETETSWRTHGRIAAIGQTRSRRET